MLTVGNTYYMRVLYETNNGFAANVDYQLSVVNYSASTIITCDKEIDEENGRIILNISGLSRYSTGYLVVRRTSHYSNFTH
jgi:hypothetical protein